MSSLPIRSLAVGFKTEVCSGTQARSFLKWTNAIIAYLADAARSTGAPGKPEPPEMVSMLTGEHPASWGRLGQAREAARGMWFTRVDARYD